MALKVTAAANVYGSCSLVSIQSIDPVSQDQSQLPFTLTRQLSELKCPHAPTNIPILSKSTAVYGLVVCAPIHV